MKYRRFGKLDWEASVLGFGAMRLPYLDGDSRKIDEPLAIEMIRYAIDHGVNYVDTGYSYHRGSSERLLGKALKDGYWEKVKLANKMPVWLVKEEGDFDRYFEEQLDRLQTDYVDLYLLHALTGNSWSNMKKLGVTEWAEGAIAEGRIGHFGFSFHDGFAAFKEIVDGYDGWEFCQIQYNYMETQSGRYGPGTEGLMYAASKGLAVVVMEPIQGGRLTVPSPGIQAIWSEGPVKRTPAEWALQWVWNQPEVSVVLSGMSMMQHVVENVESAGRSGPGTLTSKELDLIERVRQEYKELGFIGCTGCRYCVPCPQGVAIPEIFAIFNEYYSTQNEAVIKSYTEKIPPESRASLCASCGQCEELCPQQLPIMKLLVGAERLRSARAGLN
jgi:predicted aldo/keto reductase-like oxidoreductase